MAADASPQTTAVADVAEAFLRLCEALGIQATAQAHLEVPEIVRAARTQGWQLAVRWLHERSSSHAGKWMFMDAPDAFKATVAEMETLDVE